MTEEYWKERFESMSKKELLEMKKEYLRKELREYEENEPMTLSERREVRKWVRKGNSVRENPWNTAYENGYVMSFLDALRIEY
ncbi:MAG TPA: hypothetical protein DIW41_11065 [Lachnospiraceae bacterium]|jgi:hypothetical protein|nr:hypothetical protein [Lachnospiraceae bacterium]